MTSEIRLFADALMEMIVGIHGVVRLGSIDSLFQSVSTAF